MRITITGRKMTVTGELKDYAEKKFEKLESYSGQLESARVVLYVEKLDHIAEIKITGDGIQLHGKEKSDTLYSAIDLLLDKMEKQLVRYKEKISARKTAEKPELSYAGISGDTDFKIRIDRVSAKPIDRVEAYLQMKSENRDFILFKNGIKEVENSVDLLNKSYSVIYKTGAEINMVELPYECIRDNEFSQGAFKEYKLNVIDDSPMNPEIEFKLNGGSGVQKLTVEKALEEMRKSGVFFMPFFNAESLVFNVLSDDGRAYRLTVPSS